MKMKLSLLAAAIAMSPLFSLAQTTLPALGLNVHPLNATPPAATFSGGISTNGGANFVDTVPAGQPAGLFTSIKPAAAHVGTEGFLYMVVSDGSRFWMRTPSGFMQWNTYVSDLVAYQSKILAAEETISIADLEAFSGATLDGINLRIHVGYATATSPLAYSTAIIASMGTAGPNPTTCPVGPAAGMDPIVPGGKRLCLLEGTHTADVHLTSNFEYVLSGGVFIGGDNVNSASITMDAGTKIYGESGLDFLVINRGSKIHVNGTASAPVIMTSANDATATATTSGQWGGLIINGNAPINGCVAGTVLCETSGEGGTGMYGGNNPADSSGNLNYLQVKYAGFLITPTNELNGIALQGVGNGTVIDYVQVHNNADDGIEFFGGTVNAKHLYLSGNEDDSVDWTFGYSGKLQHVVVVQRDISDKAIEADNNAANRDSTPRSMPVISNLTVIGNPSAGGGILLREGTGAQLSNVVVSGADKFCVSIDHDQTFNNAGTSATTLTGNLTMTNSVANCAINFKNDVGDKFLVSDWFNGQAGNTTEAVGMTNYINTPAVNALAPATGLDAFFDVTDYRGAVKDVATDWTAGWTFK
jgi:hypothetical protein